MIFQNIKDTQKDELDYLRRAKTRAEEKLAKAKAKQEETAKQLREKVRYEADLKETNQELQKIEKLLKGNLFYFHTFLILDNPLIM